MTEPDGHWSITTRSITSTSKSGEGTVVSVTEKGQATIPKEFREKHDIDAPGKVRVRENDEGDLVIESVPPLSEMRGSGPEDWRGGERLREGRETDEDRDGRLRDAAGHEE